MRLHLWERGQPPLSVQYPQLSIVFCLHGCKASNKQLTSIEKKGRGEKPHQEVTPFPRVHGLGPAFKQLWNIWAAKELNVFAMLREHIVPHMHTCKRRLQTSACLFLSIKQSTRLYTLVAMLQRQPVLKSHSFPREPGPTVAQAPVL